MLAETVERYETKLEQIVASDIVSTLSLQYKVALAARLRALIASLADDAEHEVLSRLHDWCMRNKNKTIYKKSFKVLGVGPTLTIKGHDIADVLRKLLDNVDLDN